MAKRPGRPKAPPRDGAAPTREALLAYLAKTEDALAKRDIARAFGVKGDARADLRRMLKELEAEGALARSGRSRFADASALPEVAAVDVMSVDDDGDLLCMPATWEGSSEPPLIRLRAKEASRWKPAPGVGDRLLARLAHAGDDGYLARIIKPLGRGAHRFLAVFRARSSGGVAEPVERRARNTFSISREDQKGAKEGDLVWVEAISRRGETLTKARVREIAGHVDDRNAYSLIALAGHGVPMELPAAVVAEAEAATMPPLAGRTDLRNVALVTIDPEDAKDHDDAVWAAPDDDPANAGGFRLIVAIADVSWFVRPGSLLDREAKTRGNSVYLPDRVVPMLPERLSNNLCSLRVGEDRAAIAVEIILDARGEKRRHHFMRAVMRSAAKLSYGDAQAMIDKGYPPGPVGDAVRALDAAFRARWKERARRGPLDLDLPERKVLLNPDGTVKTVIRRERFDAHRLIEEFMILANIAAAETLERARLPQTYRVHDVPDPERLQSLRDYLDGLGFSLTATAARPANFNQLLKLAEERGQKELISDVVLRSQSQAHYDTENVGHFGLNLPRYSHFTSPIRRYSDLLIHRALVKACRLGEGGQTEDEAARLQKTAEAISDCERRAMAAEREAIDRYLASYLAGRVGDEFDGRIRGVTKFGLFVCLDETGADGFVPIRTLGPDRWRFDERRHAVIAERAGGAYRLGQKVTVRLAEAAPLRGGLRFDMLSDPMDEADLTVAGAKSSRRPSQGRGGGKRRPDAKKPRRGKEKRR